MGQAERIRRWEALIEGIRRDDIGAWRDSFVTALKSTPAATKAAAISAQALERLRAQELAGPRQLRDWLPIARPDKPGRRDPGPADTDHIG